LDYRWPRPLADAGFLVVGVDTDSERVQAIRNGRSYLLDVPSSKLAQQVLDGTLTVSVTYDDVAHADVVFICVPTPALPTGEPDLTNVTASSKAIALHLRPGQLIILQSTTYPGTTEEVVLPLLDASGLAAGSDYHLAFSPERIDPGNRQWTVSNTPKVVAGTTSRCALLARALLMKLTSEVHIVSCTQAAEMSKLLENTFRSVNIALVNEMALLCERMGLDVWEILAAAATKPFGFMPFRPGPGVGGHCIPVDPLFLSWKARQYNFHTRFVELAASVNEDMPLHVVRLVGQGLSQRGKLLNGAHILILGVAFKPNIEDPRNSPARRIIEHLLASGAQVQYHDPLVPNLHVGGNEHCSTSHSLDSLTLSTQVLQGVDAVALVTAHESLDLGPVLEHADLVIDTTNASAGFPSKAIVLRLGAPATESLGSPTHAMPEETS